MAVECCAVRGSLACGLGGWGRAWSEEVEGETDAGVTGGEGDEEAERVWDLCSLDGCWRRLGAVCCWCIVGGRLERVGFLELISMAGKRGEGKRGAASFASHNKNNVNLYRVSWSVFEN